MTRGRVCVVRSDGESERGLERVNRRSVVGRLEGDWVDVNGSTMRERNSELGQTESTRPAHPTGVGTILCVSMEREEIRAINTEVVELESVGRSGLRDGDSYEEIDEAECLHQRRRQLRGRGVS